MLRCLTACRRARSGSRSSTRSASGENFAAFMHLADYDELLVTSRIWTEPQQIEQRLADLTAHMENVIQKYLRNEFETIEEYNAQAGEVAEPFRVLVVANFPANFNETAARRLVEHRQQRRALRRLHADHASTPSSRCPPGFQLDDLEPHCVEPDLAGRPVRLEGRATSAGSRSTLDAAARPTTFATD